MISYHFFRPIALILVFELTPVFKHRGHVAFFRFLKKNGKLMNAVDAKIGILHANFRT